MSGAKKKIINLKDELKAPGFGRQEPLEGALLMVPIDHISLYDRNPRREKNPRYAEIRASLLANGLREILNVTQRPDAEPEHYMIARGGNTVLQICKEIYEQSRDKRFHIIRCNYVAWTSESDALIGHIIENNARGDIRFIDSALATLQMKKLLTEEGGGPLSDARFIKTLQDKGHALSRQQLSRYIYAAETLYPRLPRALEAGLGPWKVDEIRELQNAALKVYAAHTQAPEAAFSDIFFELLKKADDETLDIEGLTRRLCYEIAAGDPAETNQVAWQLDAALKGDEAFLREFSRLEPDAPAPDPTEEFQQASYEIGRISPAVIAQVKNRRTPARKDRTEEETTDDPRPMADPPRVSLPQNKPHLSKDNRIKSTRARLYTLAAACAQSVGIGDLIIPLPNAGTGYLVKDTFEVQRLIPGASHKDLPRIYGIASVWWLLVGFAEQLLEPAATLDYLPSGHLKDCLINNDIDAIKQRVPELPPHHLVRFGMGEMDARVYQRLKELELAYRELLQDLRYPWPWEGTR